MHKAVIFDIDGTLADSQHRLQYLEQQPKQWDKFFSESIKDKYIPLILGVIGIAFSSVWVIATLPLKNLQDIAMAVFVAGVQGILVAGLSTYVNQIIKQLNKKD